VLGDQRFKLGVAQIGLAALLRTTKGMSASEVAKLARDVQKAKEANCAAVEALRA